MTFYEAALRVLEGAGKPLTVQEITQQSVSQSLLSHVGKMPEQTMLSRLAAMARRNRDRKIIVTAKDTFALVDWGIPEDAAALAVTGVPEPNPEEDLPPYRPVERHPEPRSENVRAAGRGEKRRRRDEDEDDRRRGKRRYPPMPEVCFEILSEQPEAMKPADLLEKARSRELVSEECSEQMLLTALLEDNQRRIDAGRRPQFILVKDTGEIALERAGAPSEAPPLELQAAFAALLGIPLENGRPVLPRLGAPAEAVSEAASQLRQSAKDARRQIAQKLRRRLSELESFGFEKACVKMLHGHGFKELKVAKRNNLGPLLTARKREGSIEFRYAIRLVKGTPSIDRKAIQDLRRDMGHYAAQVGLLLSCGDVRGDARNEAQAPGPLAMVWSGDALADKFLDAKAGVSVQVVELFDLDEQFFEVVKVEAEEAARRREERIKERGGGEERRERRRGEPAETPTEAGEAHEQPAPVSAEAAPEPAAEVSRESAAAEGDEGEGDDEGDEDLEAAEAYVGEGAEGAAPGQPGAEGEPRRRRRRRRRGRRGRGPRPEGAPGQPGQGGQQQAAGAPEASGGGGGGEASPPPPPPAPPAASSGNGGSEG